MLMIPMRKCIYDSHLISIFARVRRQLKEPEIYFIYLYNPLAERIVWKWFGKVNGVLD